MYGTVSRMVVKPENREKLRAIFEADQRKVAGTVGVYTLMENDSDNLWLLAIFEDRASYDANADDLLRAHDHRADRRDDRTPDVSGGGRGRPRRSRGLPRVYLPRSHPG